MWGDRVLPLGRVLEGDSWLLKAFVRVAAYGASRPLRRIPAIVSFLNPQPALSLVDGNRSSYRNTEFGKGAAFARQARRLFA
jgi:hypothetical protein